MVDAGHSHKPNQAEIDAVKQMFACQGYTLNVEISDALPHYNAAGPRSDLSDIL